MKQMENEMNVNVPLEVIKASEIEPKEVKWLWYPYIPYGKVTLLQGDPGDGKSKLMLSIAALLSKGEPLPFTETEENEPMTIIYQTTEDDADDTVVPRFNSAGGNGENLIFIKEDEKGSTARLYQAKYAKGRIGIITPISCQFCNTCNRIRITSDGKIKLCLHSNEETDIRYYLNKPMIFKEVLKEIILKKPDKHNLLESNSSDTYRQMYEIGG